MSAAGCGCCLNGSDCLLSFYWSFYARRFCERWMVNGLGVSRLAVPAGWAESGYLVWSVATAGRVAVLLA